MSRWPRLAGVLGWELALYLLALWHLNHMAWGPREVIWSLWAASLLTGGITLLLGIVMGTFGWVLPALRGQKGRAQAVTARHIIGLALGSSAVGLFLIGFFSVHFGLFHAVHGLFLNEFFPLVDQVGPRDDLPRILLRYAMACIEAFPVFIGLCVAASVPAWLRGDHLGSAFTAPYKTVIKLHLTILGIGFADAAGLDIAAMIVFLAVYFLPLRGILSAARQMVAGQRHGGHDGADTLR